MKHLVKKFEPANHVQLIADKTKKMKKFPFNIHYVVEDNDIIILGLVHVKRSNAFIRRRLR